ncbi:hypothetical protein BDB01DRAFT_798763 [Pilobolus umbonatus]|nr:hypothetical protein BDB01DRAFT_798763 [Pilobolus umbonatus]
MSAAIITYYILAWHKDGYVFLNVYYDKKSVQDAYSAMEHVRKIIKCKIFNNNKTEYWVIRKYGSALWNQQIDDIIKENEKGVTGRLLREVESMYFPAPFLDEKLVAFHQEVGIIFEDRIVRELLCYDTPDRILRDNDMQNSSLQTISNPHTKDRIILRTVQ